ncbi:MAG: acetylornithine/succinylornithine family transaminase [Candidatus Kapabacteria bacterium]|nr:acetylornithine/succinylornithine family transaminase [Candidatus Kapabacteria bacterium]
MNSYIEKEKEYIFQTYKRYPISIEKGIGCRLYDFEGNSYLDFLGGIAVNALGHSHPKVLKALHEQMEKYLHISNYFYQEPQIKLAEKLTQMSPYDKVFFSNSGTEATEAALKLARLWGNKYSKSKVISFTNAFHGRSYGALSLMDKALYKENMGPFLQDINIIAYNNIEAIRANINNDTSAVILEFIQGEGGIVGVSEDFVKELFELRDKLGFIIIADEIQSGAGRTGKLFAFEHYGVKPDIITMAKGIGGGLPLGGVLTTNQIATLFGYGTHGTTYGGNALACAAGLVVLEELEAGLLHQVTENGNYLKSELIQIKELFPNHISEVRGIGFLQGLSLSFEASELVVELRNHKIIGNATSGNVLRIIPPLIVTKLEIDEFITALKQSIDIIKK